MSEVCPMPVVPVRDCQPWCIAGDGHVDEHPEDRMCMSDDQIVPMSLGKPFRVDDVWHLDHALLYLGREPEDDFDRVTIVHTDSRARETSLKFTVDEARQLVATVSRMIELTQQ